MLLKDIIVPARKVLDFVVRKADSAYKFLEKARADIQYLSVSEAKASAWEAKDKYYDLLKVLNRVTGSEDAHELDREIFFGTEIDSIILQSLIGHACSWKMFRDLMGERIPAKGDEVGAKVDYRTFKAMVDGEFPYMMISGNAWGLSKNQNYGSFFHLLNHLRSKVESARSDKRIEAA